MDKHPYSSKPYWRVTFMPAGAKRARTIWAKSRRVKGKIVTYTVCDAAGDEWKADGVTIEMVVAELAEVKERPARLNLHYEELELCPETKS